MASLGGASCGTSLTPTYHLRNGAPQIVPRQLPATPLHNGRRTGSAPIQCHRVRAPPSMPGGNIVHMRTALHSANFLRAKEVWQHLPKWGPARAGGGYM